MASLISPGDLRELRAFEGSLMEARCRITRQHHGVETELDEETGLEPALGGDVIYEGVCRYTTARGGGSIVLGDGSRAPQQVRFSIPWDAPMPMKVDMVEMLDAPDPGIVDAVFVVDDVEKTQYLTARKFTATTFQPKSTHHRPEPEPEVEP